MPSNKQKNITILGSTGTIGVNTLDVINRHPDKFRAYALTANKNVDSLFAQCQQYLPAYVAMLDEDSADKLDKKIRDAGLDIKVLGGMSGLEQVSSLPEVEAVMAAIVGAAGLKPALAAAHHGKRILLANKETLVMSGDIFMQAVQQHQAVLLPIDSEHNAIFQVMPRPQATSLAAGGIKRILLTASGGPFRKSTREDLLKVTAEQALNHPNWVMGPKITIDSATLMNKGLEVIEAHWLFNAKPEEIEVVVHPQSVIHSMVEYVDGSVLAQMGNPDMRTPIAYALGYPERLESGVGSLDLFKVARLDFEQPDTEKFPCLKLAFEALRMGGTASCILNAANEVAVAAFLGHKIRFMDIPQMIESVMNSLTVKPADVLETILSADEEARLIASEWINRH